MSDNNNVNLPPGFRFYPTDEELVVHFLHRKASLLPCHPDVIPDLDHHAYDPWELHGKALGEGNQWYFYSRRMKNRNTNNGYWKSSGIDEQVNSSGGKRVGMKKYFVFYVGESPSGIKTNWVMQEYRLISESSSSSNSSSTRSNKRRGHSIKIDSRWVLCRVYERDFDEGDDGGMELSCLDEVFLSLDDLDEISLP